MSADFRNILNFSGTKVLVLGDVMLDRYLIGTIERNSPEANVPVVSQEKMDERLGGAANVALNVKNLGADVFLCGLVGDDAPGQRVRELLENYDIDTQLLFSSENRKTTTKTRVMEGSKHLLRVDNEVGDNIAETLSNRIQKSIIAHHLLNRFDVIIIQDYNKGLLVPQLIEGIVSYALKNEIRIAVDPKKDNFFTYKGVDLFKPNMKELFEAFDEEAEYSKGRIEDLSGLLHRKIGFKNLLVTLSENGSYFRNEDGDGFVSVPFVQNADVCGAGDGVISMASLLLTKDISLEELTHITNFSGAQICMTAGIVPVQKEPLLETLKTNTNEDFS